MFLHAVWLRCCVALDYPGFGGDGDFFWGPFWMQPFGLPPHSCFVLTVDMCLLPGAGSGSGGGGGKFLFPGGCHRSACGAR